MVGSLRVPGLILANSFFREVNRSLYEDELRLGACFDRSFEYILHSSEPSLQAPCESSVDLVPFERSPRAEPRNPCGYRGYATFGCLRIANQTCRLVALL